MSSVSGHGFVPYSLRIRKFFEKHPGANEACVSSASSMGHTHTSLVSLFGSVYICACVHALFRRPAQGMLLLLTSRTPRWQTVFLSRSFMCSAQAVDAGNAVDVEIDIEDSQVAKLSSCLDLSCALCRRSMLGMLLIVRLTLRTPRWQNLPQCLVQSLYMLCPGGRLWACY